MAYRGFPSLLAYLIVHQDRILIEGYWRDEEHAWQHTEIAEQGELLLPCPEMTISLDQVYHGVGFDHS